MSIILILNINIPVVNIARIAGQFSKPRSKSTEIINGKEVLCFRGECINGYSSDERKPDPERMLKAYFHSSTTLNYIRLLSSSREDGLYTLLESDYSFLLDNNLGKECFTNIKSFDLSNLKKINGLDSNFLLKKPYIFTSHEGLLLEYEECMTRKIRDPETNEEKWWNLGAHFLWIGDRTRDIDGAHVEYFRGIENPIGIKIGPTLKPDELVRLLDIVDPNKELGKVTLIFRYGYDKIKTYFPQHIKAIQSSDHKVIFVCDPMHGNTLFSTEYPSYKTRKFSHILLELKLCFNICKAYGSHLDGVHFELTGEEVTECLGGSMQLEDKDLPKTYKTLCDPRLNYKQSLEIAFLIAKYWKKYQDPASSA
ncbi:hypothetical protein PNEG_03111 [Pneumocystis murina B123]|uniref:Phospho-2-dehydro-3-deoxyheptonate aldolase n=1 Tax=Pneumocystis murina (strain B123) TaxID=1069680 RepID=M7P443_PNEMU|nr:hypothetical protein PNEG_03111 [Pneumocystis murina B123]EMR08635.1 hypothetical protein PNEG_03111 [Pneumocystis murina B123]